MFMGNKIMKNSFWKIGIGIITVVIVVLFIVFFFSPVHSKVSKTIDGEYFRYKTEDHDEEQDKVVIYINGEIQKEHRFSNGDISFVGEVRVEFENNPDRNFKMERNELLFTRAINDKNLYVYSVTLDEKMYDCVHTIYLNKEGNGYQIYMYLREDWENWENWFYQEQDKQEESMANGQSVSDAVIKASFK